MWSIINGKFVGMIPNARDEAPGIWSWSTKEKARSESWQEYCARAAEESLRAAEAMRVEEESHPRWRDSLYFSLTYISEGGVNHAAADRQCVRFSREQRMSELRYKCWTKATDSESGDLRLG